MNSFMFRPMSKPMRTTSTKIYKQRKLMLDRSGHSTHQKTLQDVEVSLVTCVVETEKSMSEILFRTKKLKSYETEIRRRTRMHFHSYQNVLFICTLFYYAQPLCRSFQTPFKNILLINLSTKWLW